MIAKNAYEKTQDVDCVRKSSPLLNKSMWTLGNVCTERDIQVVWRGQNVIYVWIMVQPKWIVGRFRKSKSIVEATKSKIETGQKPGMQILGSSISAAALNYAEGFRHPLGEPVM